MNFLFNVYFLSCRREPESLVKPRKDLKGKDKGKEKEDEDKEKEEKDRENKLKKATPTTTRHLFFIRHGQYNLDGEGDINRYLTPLGV